MLSSILSPSLRKRLESMFRFAVSSGLASLIDLGIFFIVKVSFDLMPVRGAEALSSSCGMVVNFFMQKRFVFQLQRKAYAAFFLSIFFSVAVMLLGVWSLGAIVQHWPYFADPDKVIFAKIPIMGGKLVLNYFSKRWVFERKIFKA